AERVADAADRLPREVGLAGAHVHVVRHEPFVALAEGEAPLRTDDAIPHGDLLLVAARASRADDRADVRREVVAELLLDVRIARTGEDVELRAAVVDDAVRARDRPDRSLDVEVEVGRH